MNCREVTNDSAEARLSLYRSNIAGVDLALIITLAAAMFIAVWAFYNQLVPYILHYSTFDYWFESDPPAFLDQMSDRLHQHHFRTSHHPLWSILLFPLVNVLRLVLNTNVEVAIGLVMASVAAVWVGSVFFLMRVLGLRRVDSIIFTGLTAASAAVVFWFPAPETFAFGALSIVMAVIVLALSERGVSVPAWVYVLVSAGTLTFTSTNWMIGLLVLFLALPWKKALKLAAVSLGLVSIGWGVQKLIFPMAGFPLSLLTEAETKYLFNQQSAGLLKKTFVFFFHSMIMPEIGDAYGFRMTVQNAYPGAGSLLGAVGISIWLLLIIFSVSSIKDLKKSKVMQLLLLAIGGQFVLAMVFGLETFVYSAHWAPLLVFFGAMSALTRVRRFTVPLAAVLLVIAALNNVESFEGATARLREKYRNEQTFSQKVAKLTEPDALIICGRHASAGHGGSEEPSGQDPLKLSTSNIGVLDPDACYHQFNAAPMNRMGWIIPYEDWSMDLIDALRQRGAKYFITPYGYGLEHNRALFETMDKRFKKLERTPKWAFYDVSVGEP